MDSPPNCGMLCSTFWWFNYKSLHNLECKMYVTYVQVKSFSICWPTNCNYLYPRPIFAFGYPSPNWISWRTANWSDLHSVIHMPTPSAYYQMELWQHESHKSFYQGCKNTVYVRLHPDIHSISWRQWKISDMLRRIDWWSHTRQERHPTHKE